MVRQRNCFFWIANSHFKRISWYFMCFLSFFVSFEIVPLLQSPSLHPRLRRASSASCIPWRRRSSASCLRKMSFLDGREVYYIMSYNVYIHIYQLPSNHLLVHIFGILEDIGVSHVLISSKDSRQTWFGNPGCCWACLSFIACSGFTLGWCCLGMIPKSSSWIKLVTFISEFDWICRSAFWKWNTVIISHLFW